jgi:hypothetical protein
MYGYDDAGLRNVWLANGYTVRKTRYGKAVAIENVGGLTGRKRKSRSPSFNRASRAARS